jgi:hypothetical protein
VLGLVKTGIDRGSESTCGQPFARAHGATPIFFMSWAYAGRPEMTAQLAEAHAVAGNANNALVIAAGLAFARAREKQPELNLYAEVAWDTVQDYYRR